MKVIDYLIKRMEEKGITDIFGIPGGVILDLIYAIDKSDSIDIHLNYNEQMAAYAACGYAQANGKIGVVYTTRGPGFTNVYTPLVEAYGDSLSVLFITAHSQKEHNKFVRIEEEQEINHVAMARLTTKYAVSIDEIGNAKQAIDKAFYMLSTPRKGPVLLDFHSSIFMKDIEQNDKEDVIFMAHDYGVLNDCCKTINEMVSKSKRPLFLIGDGLRNSQGLQFLEHIAENSNIPIVSSRVSEDLLNGAGIYYGYIGSHGLRYSNFILSKADCIISIGNRLAVDKMSKTWKPIFESASFIRIDVDPNELERDVVESINFCIDANDLLVHIADVKFVYEESKKWIETCNELKSNLYESDMPDAARSLLEIISTFRTCNTIVNDVGNNELWTSRVLSYSGKNNVKFLLSKTMKTVGSALGKAIGAYYSERSQIMCIVGDEGLQYNIQELQYICAHKLPLIIVIWNNNSLGMLKDNETNRNYPYYLHTTLESGYSIPELEKVVRAYGIEYIRWKGNECLQNYNDGPLVIELVVDEEKNILPRLPKGNACMDFVPQISHDLFERLKTL